MSPFEKTILKNIRRDLVGQAIGNVLEIGSGSGVNFSYYRREKVVGVRAIEPNPLMQERALKKVRRSLVPIRMYTSNAEELPFPDNSFDSVIATLVFCTIPDPVKALKEIQRVAKSNAKIFLFEHVKLDQPLLSKIQDYLTPMWKKICDGCCLNRPTLNLVRESDFTLTKVETYYKSFLITIEALNTK